MPIPILYIPPCLAATLGLHTLNANNTMAYLQALHKSEIRIATHVRVQELGRPPPIPSLNFTIYHLSNKELIGNVAKNDDGIHDSKVAVRDMEKEKEDEEDERELKHYFFSPTHQHRCRRRQHLNAVVDSGPKAQQQSQSDVNNNEANCSGR
jgi:hypothetical protein